MTLKGEEIAFITINPWGPFLRSLQSGFAAYGTSPAHLIRVSPRERLGKEWRRHRLSMLGRVVLPKLRRLGSPPPVQKEDEDEGIRPPNVWRVGALNTRRTADLLKELGIRYLVNAGAGIFRKEVLSVLGLIVVNAHAGALPKYRNMNVVEWAIYNSDPVVGTVHRIDSGIDTGGVWAQKELELYGARTVDEARAMAFDQVARMVAPAVGQHALGALTEVVQGQEEGRTWYVMHPRLLRRAQEQILARGPQNTRGRPTD